MEPRRMRQKNLNRATIRKKASERINGVPARQDSGPHYFDEEVEMGRSKKESEENSDRFKASRPGRRCLKARY